MPTSLLDLMGYMQGQADTGTALRKQGQLAQLASQAYAAPRDQRGPLVQQAIATDPQSGFALDKSLQGGDDERMQRVGQMAGMLVSLPPQARAQAYPGIVQQLHSIGLGQGLPDQWSEDLLPYAQQLAGISGGGTGVQSTYIDAQGNRVAIMRDGSTQILGQNAPQNQIIDTGNGFFGVNKGNLQAQPVMVGGQQPYRIDPSLPPEVQASIQADESAYAAMPDGASVDIGQQLRGAPKQPTQAEQIAAARLAGDRKRTMTADEVTAAGLRPGTVAQMDGFGNITVAQQPVSNQGQRLSATALRQVNAAKQKLIDLQAVKNQLALVQQKFAPLKDTFSAGLGGGMLPTEDGRRYDAAVSLLQQFVRKLTRTPGEGSMSDWEGKLAMLANPSRNDYESVTQDKIDQLSSLVDQITQGYQSILADNQGDLGAPAAPSAPAAGGVDDLLSKYGVK